MTRFLPLCAILSLVETCTVPAPIPVTERPLRLLPGAYDECACLGGRVGTRDDWCSVQAPDYSDSHWGCTDGDPEIFVCMVPAIDAGVGLPTD